MSQPIWNNLKKTLDNDETIEQAIERIVQEHQDDPQSHIQPNQSLESHRTDEVIDHPEESVWNDKTTVPTRRFTAIVDPSIDDGFDTIAEAIDYTVDKGGGWIRVSSGTHTIFGALEIPAGIYLYGSPNADTVIQFGGFPQGLILLEEQSASSPFLYGFENITFLGNVSPMMQGNGGSGDYNTIVFRDCFFLQGGRYVTDIKAHLSFDRCHFEINQAAAIKTTDFGAEFFRCSSEPASGATACILYMPDVNDEPLENVRIAECDFRGREGESNNYLQNIDLQRASIRDSDFQSARFFTNNFYNCLIVSNRIDLWSGTWLNVNDSLNLVSSNRLTGGSGDQLRFPDLAEQNVAIGNILDTPITDNAIANLLIGNVGDYSPATVSASSYPTGTQSLSASTFTTIQFNARYYDQGGNMSGNAFVAPCDGIYQVNATVLFNDYSGRGISCIAVNGTRIFRGSDIESDRISALPVSAQLYLNEGDEVTIQAWRNISGSTLNTGDSRLSYFQCGLITRIGELNNVT